MKILFSFLFFVLLSLSVTSLYAQVTGDELDSLRKKEEETVDSVVFTAKYIRFTNRQLLKSATQTLPIDTNLESFQNYSPLYQPQSPTIGLGSLGIAYRDMLFTPSKTIGFDAGFHSLDRYLMTQDDIRYYRARSPYTELYYVNGSFQEQLLRVTHSQNVKPNLNIGANYNRIGSEGYYANQDANHLNAALFTWYESPNKRYNLLANALFNTIKAGENGSILNDSVFTDESTLRKDAERVRLKATGSSQPKQTWKQHGFFLRQSYYLGRMDSLKSDSLSSQILPTQRIAYAISYTADRYKFFRNELDEFGALPDTTVADSTFTNDSTIVNNLRNEFSYSFYLRGKTVGFLKNEVKLDLGLQHDLYHYVQKTYKQDFHNITLRAGIGYRFSDRVNIEADLRQIATGRNAGDFLYEANTSFLLSKSLGRIILGAYSQNKSPEQMYERIDYQFHNWNLSFDRMKVNKLSFSYDNPKLQFLGKAEYFMVDNYLYYKETAIDRQIEPAQMGNRINLLKLSVGKDFQFGDLHFDNFIVYQKTDYQDVLRTPQLYSHQSLYYALNLFKVLYTNFGVDMRFNSPYLNPAYSINTGQFYNDRSPVEFQADPIFDLWIKASLRRTNLFLRYDYANQGWLSKGFYTVKRYPMQDALLKFGFSWKFYN
ncbi:putative porin [Flavihumibacter sp. R14]|nr:putative porin [Flavihumibacter soli]